MNALFDVPPDRRATPAAKWAKYAGRDVLPMWIADMDFRAPPAIAAALADYAARGDFGYAAVPPDLPGALAAYCRRRYDWEPEPGSVVWLPALVPAIQLAVRACCAPGEAALTLTPIYPPFRHAAALQDRPGVELPLATRIDGNDLAHAIDFAGLDAALAADAPGVRLLLLCHPHNPIGRPWRDDELDGLAERARRHDLYVFSDEVHADLGLDPATRHIPFAARYPDLAARTITVSGPGKAYNTAGLGIAWAAIPDPALRNRFRRAMARLVPEPCAAAWGALRAALTDCEPWRRELLTYLAGNRDRVVDALADAGLPHTRPTVSFLAWFDARPLGRPPEQVAAHFEAHGVGLSDGADFGSPGHLRLNFALPRAQLDEGLRRIAAAVRSAG